MIELADVRSASRAVSGFAVRTPVVSFPMLDARVGGQLFLKLESLQRGGAFKARGARHAIGSLSAEERSRGVVAVSSGNHAQAVALAAAGLGVSALVLMPQDAPAIKRAATERHGADVVSFDRYATDREALLRRTADETGRVVVHPFDDERVMAGQGTAALELLDVVGEIDDLVVPVGGGGLIAGSATVMAAMRPGGRTWGVEPEAGDDARRSLAAGRRVTIDVPHTIADGQQLVTPGALPFAVMRRRVHAIVTVSDAEIVAAMRVLFEVAKLVAEPSGATALAAVLAGRVDATRRRVGVIVSGANVDLDRYIELLRG